MSYLSTLKHNYGVSQVHVWNWWQWGHFSNIILPLKAKLGGDVLNLKGCGDRMDCGKLIESFLDLEEFLKDLEKNADNLENTCGWGDYLCTTCFSFIGWTLNSFGIPSLTYASTQIFPTNEPKSISSLHQLLVCSGSNSSSSCLGSISSVIYNYFYSTPNSADCKSFYVGQES